MMKQNNILLNFAALVAIMLIVPAQAADEAHLNTNSGEYVLSIPYFEFDAEEGKQAYEVILKAPLNANPIFSVDLSSLKKRPIGNLPVIIGSNICLKTAHGSFASCQAETKMDYAIDLARCINSNEANCIEEIEEAFVNETKECKAINQARIELCSTLGGDAYLPNLDPNNFIDPTTITSANANPYFPLVRGNTWVYEAGEETITVTVTDQTEIIQDITAVVVRDVVSIDGELVEDTNDWYAQDKDGNVWYMGELSKNFEDGRLDDLEGSWRAGIESAQPGIIMYAHPENHIGETYRQEFLPGEAEDFATILSVTASTSNENFSCSGNCLQTYENSAFEPVGFEDFTPEHKFYLPGVGKIRSFHINPETGELAEGEDVDELISFTPGS
jgi:hypothetical protein